MPKELEANGYTPGTVGQRIIDAVTEINRAAAMTKQTGIFVLSGGESSKESADSESPGRANLDPSFHSSFALSSDDASTKYDVSLGGVSLTTIIFYVREFFNRSDTKISGEITREDPPIIVTGGGKDEKPIPTKFSIRLRINKKGIVQHEGEATDKLETLFEQAALKVVERFDPLNAAYYSYYKRDYTNALRIARVYLVDKTKNDKEWALNLLGLIAHAQHRRDEDAQKCCDEAINIFTNLRKNSPQFAPGLFNLGYVLIDKGLNEHDVEARHGLFRQAHEVALEGIHIDEGREKAGRGPAVGYATAGRALRYMGKRDSTKYDEALQYFDRSIQADPMFIYAYLGQSNIYHDRHAPEKTNPKYRLATEIDPSPQTFMRVGTLLRTFGLDAEAAQMFQRAAELKPSAYAYAYWGMAVRDAGQDYDKARELFEKAIAADPKIPNGYNQLGLMYLRQNKWDKASEAFTKAIEVSPQWSNYQYNLGLALRNAGKSDQAIAPFEKAIAIYPMHAWSYAQLGATLAEVHRREGGVVDEETARNVEEKLKKAVEIQPHDPVVLKTVGQAYELLGSPEQAIQFYRRAIAADEKANAGLHADIERLSRTIGKL